MNREYASALGGLVGGLMLAVLSGLALTAFATGYGVARYAAECSVQSGAAHD